MNTVTFVEVYVKQKGFGIIACNIPDAQDLSVYDFSGLFAGIFILNGFFIVDSVLHGVDHLARLNND